MTYSVRPMTKDDLDQVNEIDHEAFPSQWPPANYKQELQNKIAHYIVLNDDAKTMTIPAAPPKDNAKLVRWLMPWSKKHHNSQDATPLPVTRQCIIGFSGIWMMAGEAHITNLAIRQSYRGKGLGEFLLLASIDLAAELKASFITLEVRASNIVAQGLYGKYGFVQMGVRRAYYLDNREDAIIMSTESISARAFQSRIIRLRAALKEKLAGS